MGVDINGGKKPIFLWVDRKTQNLDFSPAELYRPIWLIFYSLGMPSARKPLISLRAVVKCFKM
jgi:hypothetical protein